MRSFVLSCLFSTSIAQDIFLAQPGEAQEVTTTSDFLPDAVVAKFGLDLATRLAAEEWLTAVSRQMNEPVAKQAAVSQSSPRHATNEIPLEFFQIPAGQGGARCMDGSPYGFYARRAPTGSAHAKDWVMFMQGGGLCITTLDCHLRAKGKFGSSTNWPQTYTDPDNMLSANETFNPFHDFNHVWLPYCSGDTHTGQQAEPNSYGLYFAGALNFEASVNELLASHGLAEAERVILSGGSAGGIGVHNNVDWLQARIPQVQVSAMPMAGHFFPPQIELSEEWVLYKAHLLRDIDINDFFSSIATTLYHSRPSPTCANHTGPEQAYRCFDASFNYDHVSVPMLVVENMYDRLMIEGVMLCLGCQLWPLGTGKLYMAHFGANMRAGLREPPKFSSRRHSAYVPSCYMHTESLCLRTAVPIGEQQLADVARAWFFDGVDATVIDPCARTNLSLPCNTLCDNACVDM